MPQPADQVRQAKNPMLAGWMYAVAIIMVVIPAAVAYEIKFGPGNIKPASSEATIPMLDFKPVGPYSAHSGVQAPSLKIGQATIETRYPGGQPLRSSRIEYWILHYTNSEREAAGLRPLTHDPAISNIARGHSRNMTRFGMDHEINGKGPTDRALEAGYNCQAYRGDGSYSYGLSENIHEYPRITRWETSMTGIVPIISHSDKTMALALVQGWMNSPGHRKNILDSNARRIGVGVAIKEHEIAKSADLTQERVFATQNFSACQ